MQHLRQFKNRLEFVQRAECEVQVTTELPRAASAGAFCDVQSYALDGSTPLIG